MEKAEPLGGMTAMGDCGRVVRELFNVEKPLCDNVKDMKIQKCLDNHLLHFKEF